MAEIAQSAPMSRGAEGDRTQYCPLDRHVGARGRDGTRVVAHIPADEGWGPILSQQESAKGTVAGPRQESGVGHTARTGSSLTPGS